MNGLFDKLRTPSDILKKPTTVYILFFFFSACVYVSGYVYMIVSKNFLSIFFFYLPLLFFFLIEFAIHDLQWCKDDSRVKGVILI